MIRTATERDLVARRARTWRDRLRHPLTLDAADRAELMRVLDELQHYAVHGAVGVGRTQ